MPSETQEIHIMVITRQIKETLEAMPQGRVFSISDFSIPREYQPALVKALSRMVADGDIRKVAKGKYYKPRQTMFGVLKPSVMEVVKDLLERNGKPVGYITGTAAFAQMGLTTQITSAITIGTNKYRRPLNRDGYSVSFLVQPNEITEENIPLLRILDALRLLRDIPAVSPDDCVRGVCRLVAALSVSERGELASLSRAYTPYVRALLGAVLECIGSESFGLRETLNGVTSYKLPVSAQALPTKSAWNIV